MLKLDTPGGLAVDDRHSTILRTIARHVASFLAIKALARSQQILPFFIS